MKICVTGGAGFIGGQLIKSLNDLGYTDILIIDNPDLLIRKDLIYTSIIDYRKLIDRPIYYFLDDVDFVFHLGANSSTRATFAQVFEQNIMFSSKLILECSIRGIYVVFASSGAVYGSDRRVDKIKPLTHYGASKLKTEKFVSYFPHENVVCLRYHNVYGANEEHKGGMSSIVSKWMADYFRNKKEQNLLFAGSDKIKRDFVHVDDINEINIMFFDYYTSKNEFPETKIYDVGTGKAISFQKVADEIVKHTKVRYKYVDNPYDSSNYQFYTKANIKEIKEVYQSVYGKEFIPLTIQQGVKKVFKDKTLQYE